MKNEEGKTNEEAQKLGSPTPHVPGIEAQKLDPLRSSMLCANGGPQKCRVTCDSCKQVFKNREGERGMTMDFGFGKDKSITKTLVKCQCDCHRNPEIKHVVACCVNGWIETEMPEFYTPKK